MITETTAVLRQDEVALRVLGVGFGRSKNQLVGAFTVATRGVDAGEFVKDHGRALGSLDPLFEDLDGDRSWDRADEPLRGGANGHAIVFYDGRGARLFGSGYALADIIPCSERDGTTSLLEGLRLRSDSPEVLLDRSSEKSFDEDIDCDGVCFGEAFVNECGCVEGTTDLDEDFCVGCTDENAWNCPTCPDGHNGNPDATVDDGSCHTSMQIQLIGKINDIMGTTHFDEYNILGFHIYASDSLDNYDVYGGSC